MLAASDDLIHFIHEQPFIADGGPQVDFTLVFPRARTYRGWVQFQRKGVVNTIHFDIPVKTLEQVEGGFGFRPPFPVAFGFASQAPSAIATLLVRQDSRTCTACGLRFHTNRAWNGGHDKAQGRR
jgi:hypothetical protein